jgi:hypothetical protein
LVNGNIDQACTNWNNSSESPTSWRLTLATVYYRLKRKADGDRGRATVLS